MFRKFAILLTLLVAMPMLASRPRIPSPDSLAALRAEVWNSWRQTWAASERTTSLPSLAPLSEARVTAWLLPDSLEPRALLRFRSGTKGTRPSSGWPCYVYLHGSGPREGEWQAGYAMAQRFDDAPSAYFIPQIPQEGAYYRWWQRSKQWAWHRLLRHLLASPEIDPARLYLFGISEGGYGSQRLASYYADYLAGAGPMAGGEPLRNAPVENLGHVAFSLLTGENDAMFYRHMLTRLTGEALDSMARLYADEYVHRVELIPGCGHGIDYSPTTPWLNRYRRQAQPTHWRWENFEMDGVKRNDFYNLEVIEETDAERTTYEFRTGHDNVIELTAERTAYDVTWTDPHWHIPMIFSRRYSPAEHGQLNLFLSETMVDLKRPVEIRVNGRRLFRGRVKPSRQAMWRSAELWGDPLRLFPVMVALSW